MFYVIVVLCYRYVMSSCTRLSNISRNIWTIFNLAFILSQIIPDNNPRKISFIAKLSFFINLVRILWLEGLARTEPPLSRACCVGPVLYLPIGQFRVYGRIFLSPPWPSGLKRWNQTLVPVVRARFEPQCGRPHFAPTRSGVRVCGRNRTEAREREWAEGTVSSLPGT